MKEPQISPIKANITLLQEQINFAAEKCGRDPASVQLVAVSKTRPSEDVRSARAAGLAVFGENYIQEAGQKIEALSDFSIAWHFIGHLQSNKAKTAVKLFDLIHTVDSFKLAKEINKQSQKINKIQNILIQVNISKESTKSGVDAEKALSLVEDISKLDHVSVKGLMTIPPYSDNPEHSRPFFKSLYLLSQTIKQAAVPTVGMTKLSMGMSHDFHIAIQEGATLVRIGTSVFGKRK